MIVQLCFVVLLTGGDHYNQQYRNKLHSLWMKEGRIRYVSSSWKNQSTKKENDMEAF